MRIRIKPYYFIYMISLQNLNNKNRFGRLDLLESFCKYHFKFIMKYFV